ncbi:type III pantothenate kinase [Cellulophaga sp. E16_2]|uniref:Type III pantothenate kinase n=1 Tax=Cellulophaga algicola (strain DSM 14237 / IC166 / ACAM 630) TaxID=688270 RepID=E6X4F4_CELAD|nr:MULTISPECIES: type III pantothenate kinase [Cellulophaga]ADV48254.1 putative transcriptional acitvator, Baf family [Cellulophaga algicola DSM 14237]MBO0590677.1 type III pantothenate kinase [Cellulophaga sp. E16_2]
MNLIIDAGNSLIKISVFREKIEIYHDQFALSEFVMHIKQVFDVYPDITDGIISSVGMLDKKDMAVVSLFCDVHLLTNQTKTPFKNSYATPETLGVDRVALATAAFYHNPSGNTLVVDAGTCITYDMVNDYGEYIGGAISPGIHMRYKALHQQTAKLPLLEKEDIIDFIGNSTNTSIHSGVVNGVTAELNGIIEQYNQRFNNLTVILTGGDALFLSKRTKNTIFANPKFLLEGLNCLLEYNKK